MKFAVAILAVLAVASPLSALQLPASGSGALAKELQDLADLIPFEKMVPIVKAYAAKEKQVQDALKVLQSNELKLFIQDVEANPEIRKLLKHIQEAGLDIVTLINKLNDIVGLDHISPLEASAGAETIPELKNKLKYIHDAGLGKIILKNRLNDILSLGHVSPLEDSEEEEFGGIVRLGRDISDLIPQAKYDEMVDEKFDNSKVFNDFLHGVFRPELVDYYMSLPSNEHWVNLIQEAEQADIFSPVLIGYFPVIMGAKIILAVAA